VAFDHQPKGSMTSRGDSWPGLSDDVFRRLVRLIREETGIALQPSKRNMLVSRLSRRLRALGLDDFSQYCRLLESDGGMAERRALISAITTNVTSFFREPHHFEALSRIVPELALRARAGGRVRIWSAACATGQEPYSIAVTILARWPDAVRFDVRILATDIDPEAVETARRGVYPESLVTDVPEALRRQLVPGPTPGTVAVGELPRELLRFEELNLLGPWPFRGLFDVIFCRNVVIYFDAATRSRLWARLAERLVPGGLLFVGHSETIERAAHIGLVPVGITQYRRDPDRPVSAAGPIGDNKSANPDAT
jgi:chemotaxis protein methyltransferase CheR